MDFGIKLPESESELYFDELCNLDKLLNFSAPQFMCLYEN